MFEDSHVILKYLENPISFQTEEEKTYLLETFYTNGKVIDNLSKIKSNSSQYYLLHERPDLIIIGEKIICIEHFEIDASFHTKKGSQFRHTYNSKYYLRENEIIQERLKKEDTVFNVTEIKTDLKYDYLKRNLISIIDSHYENIPEYEKEVTRIPECKNKTIEYIFFVEYKLMIPSFFQEGNKNIFFLPHNDIEIINYLKQKKMLSGIFFCNAQINAKPDLRFILTSETNLQNYNTHTNFVYDLSEKEYYDFSNPSIASISFNLPIDKKIPKL